MTRYYLGIRLDIDPDEYAAGTADMAKPGWVWATWPDGRRFLHWSDQLTLEPWG